MFCGSDMVADLTRKFLEQGLEPTLGIVENVTPSLEWSDTFCNCDFTPRDLGYFRTRWSCEILSEVLREQKIVACSGKTVRRWMHRFEFAWRRPRPIVGPSEPFHFEKK
jgi:hypothetical protein